jgi:hypothetical protein
MLILLLAPKFFSFFQFVSKQICLFRLFRYGSETPKRTETNDGNKKFIGCAKQTENELKQAEFRFVLVQTKNIFSLFRGHPTFYTVSFFTVRFNKVTFHTITFYTVVFYTVICHTVHFLYKSLFIWVIFYNVIFYTVIFNTAIFYTVIFYTVIFYAVNFLYGLVDTITDPAQGKPWMLPTQDRTNITFLTCPT